MANNLGADFGQQLRLTNGDTGREYDREIGLYYYRARYYSADLGRFISRDPIGVKDNVNLYSYVGNNSVKYIDPMGLEKKLIVWTITIYSLYADPYIFLDWHSLIELNIDWKTTTYWIWQDWNMDSTTEPYVINSNSDIVKNFEWSFWYKNKNNVESIWLYITWYEYEKIINDIGNKVESWYKWGYFSPCSDFASDIWNSVSDYDLSDRNLSCISNPDTLANSIENLQNDATNYFNNLNNASYWQWTVSQQTNLYKNLIY